MKLFWAIIVIFIAAAGFVVFAQSRSNGPAPLTAQVESVRPAGEMPTAVDRSPKPVESTYESSLFAEPEPDSPVVAVAPEEAGEDDSDGSWELSDSELAADQLAEDLLASSQQPRDGGGAGSGGEHPHQSITTGENPWAQEGELALGDERMAASRLKHSVVEQDDGSLLLDETFTIRGQGTAADPYEITWDLLMSAAESYQPRLGMEEIPERVQMLDGKHVRISGHLMFPMITGEANELLVMLNMWDGCCIGTMPSPYDAIEVRLASPAPVQDQQHFTYGTIEGKLSIDPYLINDWLIGLYLMDDATLQVGM